MSSVNLDDLVVGLPVLVPLAQVAQHLHVSTRTVRTYIAQHKLAAVRTSERGSGRVLVPRVEIARFLASSLTRAWS